MKRYAIFLTSVVFALLINDSKVNAEPNIQAMNTYLFGHPNPKWLQDVNNEGHYDSSLDPNRNNRAFNPSVRKNHKNNYNEVIKPVFSPSNLEGVLKGLLTPVISAVQCVEFYLYTRNQSESQKLLLENLESIKTSSFDPKQKIKILIHGWRNDVTSEMIQMIKNAYLTKGDFNVIVVDWSNCGDRIDYTSTRHRVKDVAAVLTHFIKFLIEKLRIETEQIHIIGHSLGAHIAGITGKSFETNKIEVIVGLDPAKPLFYMSNPEGRLDKTDARYVEVLHTSAGSLGFAEPLGTADFYFNYGRSQPGCGLDLIGNCAHKRAYQYFAESILSDDGFSSHQCGGKYNEIVIGKCVATGTTVSLRGYPIEVQRASGNFYLETNDKSPFIKRL